MEKLEITTDISRIDTNMVYNFLSTSYWARERPRALVEKSIRHSLCFSGFIGNRQVAFGRVITDKAVFAYVADVFVLPAYRGQGYASEIIRAMLNHDDLKDIQLTMLATRDTHSLYEKFGFKRIPGSEKMMALFAMEADYVD